MVSKIALAAGQARRISRAASMPFRSGIEKSSTTTSGQRSRAARSASWPSVASATTAKPSRSSGAFKPCRTIAWSSGRRIRFGTVGLHRYGDDQLRAASWRRDDVQRPTPRVQTLLNAGEPEPPAPPRQLGGHVEPDPVVPDGADHGETPAREGDGH